MSCLKIALLGANSQLGFDLIRQGQKLYPSWQWIAITRRELEVTQLSSIDPFLRRVDCDLIINCISYNKTEQAEKEPLLAFQINGFAVKEMAKVAKAKKIPFIHISSDYVFDGSLNRPYLEADTPAPLSVYGSSKLLGEQFALAYCSKSSVFRTASLFGLAGSSGKGGNFVETVVRILNQKQEMSVIKDIQMSPTGTYDLAFMILQMISQGSPVGLFHAVNRGFASWYDLAVAIQKMAKLPGIINPVLQQDFPVRIRRPSFSVMDNEKIQGFLPIIPTWQEALDRYLKDKMTTN